MASKIDPAELRTTNVLLKDFAAEIELSAEILSDEFEPVYHHGIRADRA